MKRRPVLLYLGLFLVALLADDARFIFQLPVAVGEKSSVAIHADSSAPIKAIRLLDGVGAALEVVRGGRPLRDSAATPFAERRPPLDLANASVVASVGQVTPASSSLVSKHTQLQI